MTATAEIGTAAAAALAVCGVLGLAVRLVLVPYLREHLVVPVEETHRQVTPKSPADTNHTLTMAEKVDDVQTALDRLTATTTAVQAVANAAARSAGGAHRRLDAHVDWAREEDTRLWRAISDPRHRAGEASEEQQL